MPEDIWDPEPLTIMPSSAAPAWAYTITNCTTTCSTGDGWWTHVPTGTALTSTSLTYTTTSATYWDAVGSDANFTFISPAQAWQRLRPPLPRADRALRNQALADSAQQQAWREQYEEENRLDREWEQRQALLEQRRAEQDEERRQAHQERIAQGQAAEERAGELLRSLLTDEQWTEWRRRNYFHVTTPAGHRYRIERGTQENVFLLDDNGGQVETLCAGPERRDENGGLLPVTDVVIGQLLALRANEAGYRMVANITNHRTGGYSHSGSPSEVAA